MRNGKTHSDLRRSLLLGGSAAEWRRQLRRHEALRREVAEIGHDLNNLLLVIGTAATATRRGIERDPRITRHLSSIDDAVAESAALARRLLTLARPAPARLERGDLVEHVRRAAEVARWLLPASVSLQVQVPDRPVPVRIDRTQFLRVVNNLVANCADALGEQGTAILRVRLAADDGPVWLEVEDDGPGVPEEVRERVFDPYFSTRDSEGTGLGLAVVQGIARRHGGTVRLERSSSRGATFSLVFPVA